MARIAIVVPTYNRARTVARAIDSALDQGRADVCCVVVDDGSTDDTPAVLARYRGDPRVEVHRLPANRGVAGAKNAGLDRLPADCRYFGILDSDDVLVGGALSRLVAVFETGADYSQVFGWCEDPATGERTGRASAGPVITYEDALRGGLSGEFWQLVRRDLLGAMRFEERAAGGESSLWWRIWKNAPAYLVPEVVRRYDRSGADRVSVLRFDAAASAKRMWSYRAKLEAAGDDLRAVAPGQYAEHRLEEAKWAALAGRRRESLQALGHALASRPSLRTLGVGVATLLPAPVLRRVYAHRYAPAGGA